MLTKLPEFEDSLVWREDWEEFGADAFDGAGRD